MFLSSKEEFEMDEALYHYPKKQQCELLKFFRDTEVVEPCMFGKGMYFLSFIDCVMKWIYLKICQRTRCRKREIWK